jgi:acyl-CoA reductase-like NAD-dependent aldehyde dehydrogenase
VLNGAVEESTQLLNTHFDYIFYTGNGTVGRIVMQAASKNLTPVTLELGGKSPVVIHKSCNIQVSAQRIFFGKFSNCGQTCIAPDYVLCPSDLIPKFVDALQNAYLSSFGGDALKSDCYGRIINHRHFDRLEGLLKESISQGAEVLIGGATKRDIKYIEPTVLKCTKDVALMRDEIFGPFLPIIPTETIDEAIDFINSRDQPLALYVFATDKAVIDKVLGSTRSGGVCINDTVINYAVPQLPFGGVGQSGMGRYRGKYGFDTFTYMRSVIHSGYLDEPLRKSVLYPPYSVKILPLIKFASSGYTRTGKRIKWTFIFSLLFFVLAYWARLRANTN